MNQSIIQYVTDRVKAGATLLDVQFELLAAGYTKEQIVLILSEAGRGEVEDASLDRKKYFLIGLKNIPYLFRYLIVKTIIPLFFFLFAFSFIAALQKDTLNQNIMFVLGSLFVGLMIFRYVVFHYIVFSNSERFNYRGCLIEQRRFFLPTCGLFLFVIAPVSVGLVFISNIYLVIGINISLYVLLAGLLVFYQVTQPIDLLAISLRYCRFKYKQIFISLIFPVMIFLTTAYLLLQMKIAALFLSSLIFVLSFFLLLSLTSFALDLVQYQMNKPKSWTGYRTLAVAFLLAGYGLSGYCLYSNIGFDWDVCVMVTEVLDSLKQDAIKLVKFK